MKLNRSDDRQNLSAMKMIEALRSSAEPFFPAEPLEKNRLFFCYFSGACPAFSAGAKQKKSKVVRVGNSGTYGYAADSYREAILVAAAGT